MPRKPELSSFQTNVPRRVMDRYLQWRKDNGNLPHQELAEAMLRLFLAVPPWLRVLARSGEEGEQLIREAFAGLRPMITFAGSPSAAELAAMAEEDADAVLGGAEGPGDTPPEAAAKAG